MGRRTVVIGLLLLFGVGAACSSFSEADLPAPGADAGPDAPADDSASVADANVDVPPELFAANQSSIVAMVADGDSLYWALAGNDTLVMRRSFEADGSVQALAGTSNATDIAVDDSYLYWTDSTNLARVPKDGGAPLTIDTNHQASLAVDDTYVYWSDPRDSYIQRKSKKPGDAAAESFVLNIGHPNPIALDDTYLYVVSDAGGLQAYDKSVDTPPAISLESSSVNDATLEHGRIAAGGGAVFFRTLVLNLESIDVHGNHSRYVISDAGAAVSVGSDGTNVLWTEDSAPDGGTAVGRVRRATALGAAPTDLATEQLHPSLVVAGGDHVYWVVAASDGTWSIMRRPK